MAYNIDLEKIGDSGFDSYLRRPPVKSPTGRLSGSRQLSATNLIGGTIGNEGIVYLGSLQVRIDGKEQRILVNDGTNDVVLIGKF